jgi:hypothetical protein
MVIKGCTAMLSYPEGIGGASGIIQVFSIREVGKIPPSLPL